MKKIAKNLCLMIVMSVLFMAVASTAQAGSCPALGLSGPHCWDPLDFRRPDCTSDTWIFFCEYCYETKTEAHIPEPHTINWYSNYDATCTEDGTKTLYCTKCDYYKETVTDEGTALGHDYNPEWTVLTSANCTHDGISVRACKRCVYIDVLNEAALGHKDGDADGKCDECAVVLDNTGSAAPDDTTPDTPENPDENETTDTPEEDLPDIPSEPEQPKKEGNVFSFLTEFLNNILDFFRALFGIK